MPASHCDGGPSSNGERTHLDWIPHRPPDRRVVPLVRVPRPSPAEVGRLARTATGDDTKDGSWGHRTSICAPSLTAYGMTAPGGRFASLHPASPSDTRITVPLSSIHRSYGSRAVSPWWRCENPEWDSAAMVAMAGLRSCPNYMQGRGSLGIRLWRGRCTARRSPDRRSIPGRKSGTPLSNIYRLSSSFSLLTAPGLCRRAAGTVLRPDHARYLLGRRTRTAD